MKDLNKYEAAEVEIVKIKAEDVITTSGPFDFEGDETDNKW